MTTNFDGIKKVAQDNFREEIETTENCTFEKIGAVVALIGLFIIFLTPYILDWVAKR